MEQAGSIGWKGNDEARWHAFKHGLRSKHLYGDGGLLSMLVDSDLYYPATARLMLEGKQVSRGNTGTKLMLEALCHFGRGCKNVIRQILEEMTWINL